MGGTALLGSHEVHRDDHAHQQVLQEHQRTEHTAGDGDHQHLRPGKDLIFQPLRCGLVKLIHLAGYPNLHGGVALQQMLHPAADGIVVAFHAGNQLHHAPVQLRDQHMAQQIAEQADDDPGHHQTDGPGAPGGHAPLCVGLFHLFRKKQVFNKVDDRRQQVRQHRADQNRLQCFQQLTAEGWQYPAAKQGIVKKQDRAHGQKEGKSPPHRAVFFLHPTASCRQGPPACGRLLPKPLYKFYSTRRPGELQSSIPHAILL